MNLKDMAGRCIVKLLNSAGTAQTAQIRTLPEELADNVEYAEPYGFTATAPAGKREGVALFLGGDRGNGLLLCVANRQYRLAGLKEGETAMYDNRGQSVVLRQDGSIVVTAKQRVSVTAEGAVTVTAPEVVIEGNVHIRGNLSVSGSVKHDGIDIGRKHTHDGVKGGTDRTGGVG